MVAHPVRGGIYWARFDPVEGAEIGKTRPALVVQNDVGNRHSSTVIVAAISSRYPDCTYPFLVSVPSGVLPRPSAINCAHLRTFDKRRLGTRCLGVLDEAAMRRVDEALKASLGLG